jgi:phosphoribosylformylglycinamidine cyclo-ligase
VLVSSTDGVGTKLKVALALGRHDTVGIDLVNACLNDIVVTGADPLFFLDYLGLGALRAEVVEEIVGGVAAGCAAAGIPLIGGETAQMPDTYLPGAYDLAGTMIGVVERSALPDPARVEPGDVILGLPSTGLHTNGYSLARGTAARLGRDHLVGERTLTDALLAPHPSYLAELGVAFGYPGVRVAAHITGGGLVENVPRVLPPHLGARFDVRGWAVPPVFELIAADQGVAPAEMYRVFNMGIGMAIVVAADAADALRTTLPGAFRAGEIVERGDAPVVLEGL